MKKLGDAIGDCWDNAGHMGREESAAEGGVSPHTPFPVNNIKHVVVKGVRSTPPVVPPTQTTTTGFVGVTFEEVLEAANRFEIPEWYAAYWFKAMNANGWVTSGGVPINNWRPLLRKWWQRATELEKAKVEADYLAEQKSAAEDLNDPEPQIEITRHHWYECQRTCAYFKKGKCLWGARHPAVLYKRNDGFTDRCYHFKPLPLEWQNAWVLEFPGSVKADKLQHVKDYFAAHPDELAEAKWRNDANEPTEEECAAVRAWLAWVSRAKARGKARKEAGE